MLSFEYEGRGDELEEYLEARLAGYLAERDVENPPTGVPRKVYDRLPFSFGGKFPTLGVSVTTSSGSPQDSDTPQDLPGVLVVELRIYDLSISADRVDGRSRAKERTRAIDARWKKALADDAELHARLSDWEIAATEQGDEDRFGNPFMVEETRRSRVWVRRSEVRLFL